MALPRTIAALLAACLLCFLPACSTPGASTIPITTQGAQNVGGDQGAAQATETSGSHATTNASPVIVFGAKTIEVKPDGSVSVEANPEATVQVTGTGFGNVTVKATQDVNSSSGGPTSGGTGGVGSATSPGPSEPEGGGQ